MKLSFLRLVIVGIISALTTSAFASIPRSVNAAYLPIDLIKTSFKGDAQSNFIKRHFCNAFKFENRNKPRYISEVKLRNPLVFEQQNTNIFGINKFRLQEIFGITLFEIKARSTLLSIEGGSKIVPHLGRKKISRFSTKKTTGAIKKEKKLNLMATYFATERFGIRIFANYKHINSLNDTQPNVFAELHLIESVAIGLGFSIFF